MNILTIDCRHGDPRDKLGDLRRKLSLQGDVVSEEGRRRTIEIFGEPLSPVQVVERICRDVRTRGIEAVLDYAARIDRVQLTPQTLRVTDDELEAAHAGARPELLSAVRRVKQNILKYQQALLARDVRVEAGPGSYLAQRYVPLRRVGVCVPGGAAAYPSTVLMTVVPAQAAGVREIAVVAPPTAFGSYNADLLATCKELGVSEVYRLGGAQAVAVLAYGAKGIPPVDKIVGPGNLFVALAKKFVYGEVDIDSIAGPSEVVVIADASTRPDFTAADMLAQAEHSPGASILITWSPAVAEATLAELEKQLAVLSRGDLARASLEQFGAIVITRDAHEAVEITDLIAPEHLHIATENAEELLKQIHNAGATFLGNFSPVAAGDYAAGPSHVLPTSGTARFASGLNANHYLRGHSVIALDRQGLERLAPDIRELADVEGLTAHRASVDIRLG